MVKRLNNEKAAHIRNINRELLNTQEVRPHDQWLQAVNTLCGNSVPFILNGSWASSFLSERYRKSCNMFCCYFAQIELSRKVISMDSYFIRLFAY